MGTISDLNELNIPAVDDYMLVRETSDLVDRDKKMKIGKFPFKDQVLTPTAGRVACWKDANSLEDGLVTLTGTGTLATGAFTGTIPSTGTFAMREAANIFTLMQQMNAGLTIGASGAVLTNSGTRTLFNGPLTLSGFQITPSSAGILDDTAIAVPVTGVGFILLVSGTADATVGALVAFRAYPTPHAIPLGVASNVNVTTGVLTGTTGVDGKFTISAHSDSNVYLENRRGGTRSTSWLVLAGG